MRTNLTFEHTRIIGALIEKSITTPDQYPLSLNSLTLACNQKSNREPVVSFSDGDTQHILDELEKMSLIMTDRTGRVNRYKHRFCNTEFSDTRLTAQELAVICVMFLRGPQTPGELRTRTQRLCDFTDVTDVESLLSSLASLDTPLVMKLAREPGKREARYTHLYSGEPDISETPVAATLSTATGVSQIERIEILEAKVAELQSQLAELLNNS